MKVPLAPRVYRMYAKWKYNSSYTYLYSKVKYYIRNLIMFHKLCKQHRPWDYSGLLLGMKIMMQDMENCQRVYSKKVGADEAARQLRVCSHLCDRLLEDEYFLYGTDNDYSGLGSLSKDSNKWYAATNKARYKKSDAIQKQDLELLTSIMNKKLLRWWD